MNIKKTKIETYGIKLELKDNGETIGHAYVYILKNDLHEQPLALIEDLLVDEKHRGKGLGSMLVQSAIEEAKRLGCYKIISTSRHERVKNHEFYRKLNFKNHGLEFRIDL